MDELKEFGAGIAALIEGRNLSRQQATEAFRQVLLDKQPDLQQGAFLAALTAKGETAEEIAAAWEAIYEMDTAKVTPAVSQPLVENCGTGMDTLKTFNISTAAAVVAAASGVTMAKHGARALTSACGAVDILEAVGVDVECDVDTVKRSIERTGIGIFNGMSAKVHPQALFRILSQIRFGTTLNIAGSLANPALPRRGARGVYSRELVAPVAQVMAEIGYQKALVFYGSNGNGRGMDEISTLGETAVAELDGGDIESYILSPDDFGIRRASESALQPSPRREEEVLGFLRILSGSEEGPRRDIVRLNTAPIFYLAGQARNLKEGFALAEDVIASGKAVAKLREWVEAQNSDPASGLKKLEGLLKGLA